MNQTPGVAPTTPGQGTSAMSNIPATTGMWDNFGLNQEQWNSMSPAEQATFTNQYSAQQQAASNQTANQVLGWTNLAVQGLGAWANLDQQWTMWEEGQDDRDAVRDLNVARKSDLESQTNLRRRNVELASTGTSTTTV
jgi:hypothetical protein